MKILAPLGVLAAMAVITASQTASAAWQPSYWRCAADQFPHSGPSKTLSQRLALGRTMWAKDALAMTGSAKYWDSSLDAEVTAALAVDLDLYPVYADMAVPTVPVWIGPGPNVPIGDPRYGTSYIMIRSKTPNLKPMTVEIAGLCEPGCYTPEQEVHFSTGPVPILEALRTERTDVVTLAPGSSFGSFSFITNEVARYTQDIEPAAQDIVVLRMRSGGELKVTTQHPLLSTDGTMRTAKDFRVGESLVREDGEADPIESIETVERMTKTYNLRPVTTDLISNILVAQGYLSGSARYQSELVEHLNRALWRRKIPVNLIPNAPSQKASR